MQLLQNTNISSQFSEVKFSSVALAGSPVREVEKPELCITLTNRIIKSVLLRTKHGLELESRGLFLRPKKGFKR